MQKFPVTVIASVLFFAVVGPAVPLVEMFFIKLISKGVFEPVLAMYPVAIIFGGGLFAAIIGLGYGFLLALALRFPLLRKQLGSKLRLAILGATIGIICSASMGTYIALQEQKRTDGLYQGKLEKFKPEGGLWRAFMDKRGIELLLIPSLVCGIAFPLLLLPNPAVKRDAPQAARPLP